MNRLKGKDIDQIINLMQIYPAPLKTGPDVLRFFQEIQKAFDSDELVFLFPNSATNGIDLKRSFSLQQPNSFLSRYADYFWRYDPIYQVELSPERHALAFRTQDVIPYSYLIKLKYYSDFLQPQNLLGEMVIRLFFNSFFLGAISLLRSKNKPLFAKKDVRKAEMLIPYIVNSIDVGDMFSRGFEEQKLFEKWLQSQAEGIILLDSDYRALYFNSRASYYCLQLAGRNVPTGPDQLLSEIYIPDMVIQDCRRLARNDRRIKNNPGYENRIVNLANHLRFHLQYFTFMPEIAGNTRPSFIIVINDLNRYSFMDDIIVSQAKLSNQETVVAKYAGMGWTNKEIADSLHSSPFTVQNQLRKVFEKTGLKNRTQLANLMKYSDGIHNVKQP